MTPDEPLDLAAVAADEAALEALRDGVGDDAALALLRELVLDVERDLPDGVPVGRGSTVLALAAEDVPERRVARGGAVVAALTAGVLSLGGVAAASPADSPLHGLGEKVRSAAGALVGAVTPPQTPTRSGVGLPAASASPAPSPPAPVAAPRSPAPGPAVAAAARSQAAARQVAQLLDAAEELLRAGRTSAAVARLDLAERRLPEVLPAQRAALADRLAALRAQVPPPAQPARTAPEKKDPPKQQPATRREEPPAKPAAPRGDARTAPPDKGGSKGGDAPRLGQLSRDASTKPRA